MKKLLYFILILLMVSCNTSKDRVEVKLMGCIYSSFTDKGALFKQAMLDHEQYLITAQILKDKTGNSYVEAFKKVNLDNTFNITETFSEEAGKLEEYGEDRVLLISECGKNIDSNIFDFEKGNKLREIIALMGMNEKVELSSAAKDILLLLDEDDFELDYYKLNAFLIFDRFKLLKHESIAIEAPELDLSNALKISDIKGSKVKVNTKEVELKKLRFVIIDYLKKNSETPIISIKTDSETSYKDYIAVKNEITSASNFFKIKSAKEKFNTTYLELNENDKSIIDSLHEIKIVE